MTTPIKTKATYHPDARVPTSDRHKTKGQLCLFGALICLTGIGALIGIPMIVAGFFMKSYEKGSWVGKCPKCSSEIYWYDGTADAAQGELSCPTCHASITFYGDEFVHIPPA